MDSPFLQQIWQASIDPCSLSFKVARFHMFGMRGLMLVFGNSMVPIRNI